MILQKNSGFTLIEIAIVLLIVAIILGYTVAMVPVQQELKQYRQADAEMTRIIDSLYAFAQVNGYLPCPAFNASNGFECRIDDTAGVPGACDGINPNADSCDDWFGFVPGKSLGIEGRYSSVGMLLDPWGMPYRYQITDSDHLTAGANGEEDFVIQGEMSDVGISNLAPDLSVCSTTPVSALSCGTADKIIVSGLPAVILTTGKDMGNVASGFQDENLDNSAADRVFVKTTFNHTAGSEFDDLVKWISPNILYSKMIQAGQLP